MTIKLMRATFLCFLFFSSAIKADTNIHILNNTDEEINFLISGDEQVITSTGINRIKPYSYAEIANLSRYSGIEYGKDYYFFIFLGYEHLTPVVKLKGTAWGANMSFTLVDPETTHMGELDDDREIHGNYKGDYQYHYKAEYTGGYDDITFVISEEPTTLSSNENSINILTYNVWLLPFVGEHMNHRDRRIADAVSNNDVVFMQEVFRRENEVRLNAAMQSHFQFVSNKLDGGGSNTYDGGVITYSKYPIVEQAQHVFDNCKGTDCAADKGVLYTKIIKDSRPYHLFNLHLGSWNSREHRNIRMLQVGEILAFVEQLDLPQDEPVIFGGDFNIAKHKFPIDFTQMLRILNLREPPLEGSLIYSYDPLVNQNLSNSDEFAQERLDYLLYSDNGSVVASTSKIEVLRSFDEEMWGVWDLSDHLAMSGRFEVP
ncbi:endonuclease [Vibrio sp. 10N.286.51.C3]|uniref:sphingomyelin phosphodiesterase n=1 Tax=unclassified Vibrio TaxID=2614977 RepID=UPI000D37C211|nr:MULTISPECIES: sphingomyelin phosphodiesterase [unclassified Vibrio]PTP12437.1 endonuclease [Vibrio sp. 10N.286.51.C3]PTQ00453.1 endonuclease [Vibrio sp. ZF 223]TKE64934.1 endonuclease [Vibrio sp. F12]